MQYASIGPIAVHFPSQVETNAALAQEFPEWNLDLISTKTGIGQRYIAAEDECASDLAVQAAEKLFTENDIDPSSIDFLLLCTQTPDYPLPTTACLLQYCSILSLHWDKRGRGRSKHDTEVNSLDHESAFYSLQDFATLCFLERTIWVQFRL